MKNKAYNLSSYSFSSDEQVLLDANVWLYLFPAPGKPPYNHADQYSEAFANLLKAQAKPILDPIILSEYLNSYIRIEWKAKHTKKLLNFKKFRNSSDFASVSSTAKTFAKKILSLCQIHSIPANELDLTNALASFSTGCVDFNDAILIDICKKRNLKLMTNDGDFNNGGIEILTTNPRLLQACS